MRIACTANTILERPKAFFSYLNVLLFFQRYLSIFTMVFIQILITTLLIASVSLVGFLVLSRHTDKLRVALTSLVALSAGAMLGNAFFHLLPEAIELSEEGAIDMFTIMLLVVGSFVASFLFEQFFAWHHCHGSNKCDLHSKPYAQLLTYSDGIHNFVDGLIIAAAFIVSPALGVTTAIAIALHEIPQELGDFAVLIHAGWTKSKALLVNTLAALTVVLGGVAGYFLTSSVDVAVPILLPIATGSFIYIAAADLLPELKRQEDADNIPLHFLVFLTGLIIMIVSAMFE